jgi:hypothetical protein
MAVAGIDCRHAHPKEDPTNQLNILEGLLIHAQHHELVEGSRNKDQFD